MYYTLPLMLIPTLTGIHGNQLIKTALLTILIPTFKLSSKLLSIADL